MTRSGVVLAGGRSTRFGERDKALEPLAGVPMTRRVGDRVATVADEVVVNCRSEQESAIQAAMAGAAYPVEVAVDPVPDRGPVAGIRTGLAAASGEYSAVVACDMPFVDPDFIAYLFSRAADRDGAVPRPDEFFEVTQAVYRTDAMLDACDRALERDDPKVLEPLEYLDVAVVDGREVAAHATPGTFQNVNTPEDFASAAAMLDADADAGGPDDEE